MNQKTVKRLRKKAKAMVAARMKRGQEVLVSAYAICKELIKKHKNKKRPQDPKPKPATKRQQRIEKNRQLMNHKF